MKIEVKKYQNLFDVAIQHYGSIGQIYDLAQALGVSPTDDLPVGTMVIPDTLDVNRNVVTALAYRGAVPATSVSEAEILTILNTGVGIDHWKIEHDFIVS